MKPHSSDRPLKYEAVAGELRPCLQEIQDLHLKAFIDAFILEENAPRWAHCLIEKPEKARECMAKFPKHFNQSFCTRVTGIDAWPSSLKRRLSEQEGVYFTGTGIASTTTLGHAASLGEEAIFSSVPGKVAIFFHHEGWAWLCEK